MIKRSKQALERFLLTHPTTFCDWDERLRLVQCPDPQDEENFTLDLLIALVHLVVIMIEYLIHCFCSAWLPLCPEVCDARVPLAKVTVTATGDCRVVRICNLTLERQFVRTAPNMKYWFSPLQIGRLVREALERLCCEGFELDPIRDPRTDSPPGTNVPDANVSDANVRGEGLSGERDPVARTVAPPVRAENLEVGLGALPSRHFARRMGETVLSAITADGEALNVQDFFQSLTGSRDAAGNRVGSIQDVSLLPAWFVGRAIARPLWESTAPENVRGIPEVISAVLGSGTLRKGGIGDAFKTRTGETPEESADVSSLRDQLTEVQREVAELRARIRG